jgi:UDP-N-acetylglucosamine/UDP-N-acetyl-alpha-D-glucosaminouronate 4-epimerase
LSEREGSISDAPVLVTGGAGFIGAHIVRGLLARGHQVRVLDDLSSGNLDNLKDAPEAEVAVGDFCDPEVTRKALDGVEVVYHIGADPSVPRSVEDPRRAHEINATGTLILLNEARAAGIARVVYASTSAVYGDADIFPTHEEAEMKPVSPYGAAKLAGELYCRSFTRVYGFPTVSLRYFNVYGPGQPPDSYYVVPQFVRALFSGEPANIEGDGSQTRDFVFVDDVVQATLKAGTAGPAAFGGAYNVGSGHVISILQMLDMLKDITGGHEPAIRSQPPRLGDVHDTHANLEASARDLGYAPEYDLDRGLRATVDWLASVTSGV